MAKFLVVSYSVIPGIPVGRHELCNTIVYSTNYRPPNARRRWTSPNVIELELQLEMDIYNKDIVEAYVYLSVAMMNGAMDLIRALRRAGKKVRMVACDCEHEIKQRFAEDLDLRWIKSECGGRETCAELIRKFANEQKRGD